MDDTDIEQQCYCECCEVYTKVERQKGLETGELCALVTGRRLGKKEQEAGEECECAGKSSEETGGEPGPDGERRVVVRDGSHHLQCQNPVWLWTTSTKVPLRSSPMTTQTPFSATSTVAHSTPSTNPTSSPSTKMRSRYVFHTYQRQYMLKIAP